MILHFSQGWTKKPTPAGTIRVGLAYLGNPATIHEWAKGLLGEGLGGDGSS